MWSATSSTKCCATCANWGGDRKLRGTSAVETPQTDTRGKCYEGVTHVTSNGHPACGGISCPKYRKLGVLR